MVHDRYLMVGEWGTLFLYYLSDILLFGDYHHNYFTYLIIH